MTSPLAFHFPQSVLLAFHNAANVPWTGDFCLAHENYRRPRHYHRITDTLVVLPGNGAALHVPRHRPKRPHPRHDGALYYVVQHPSYSGGILIVIDLPLWHASQGSWTYGSELAGGNTIAACGGCDICCARSSCCVGVREKSSWGGCLDAEGVWKDMG